VVVRAAEDLVDGSGLYAGAVRLAAIAAPYSGTVHSLVQKKGFEGPFLPGFAACEPGVTPTAVDPMAGLVEVPNLTFLDHCVSNQPDAGMEPVVRWYEEVLGFHRFWSIDDTQLHTEYSSLRSIVVCDPSSRVKMPINEPAAGRRKSQIQEYVDYFGGLGGIQHIALHTPDIIKAVAALRARGVSFIRVPKTYYTDLRERLGACPSVKVVEDLDELERLNVLVDFDEGGYLLQIFTRPLQDRPTFFIEVIQRRRHNGFGAGNFKSLFEAIERDQEARGNL